jgi:hypothetical protein
MPKVSDLKLPKLSSDKYNDVVFKLHYITDISTKPGENYYNAIFKSIKAKKDFFIQENIYPELLNHYIIGTHYRNGKRIGKSQNLELMQIKLPIKGGQTLKIWQINNITKPNVSLEKSIYLNDIKNQYAYFGILDDYYVIIPAHVIGSAFYFTSTVMRERIFESKIESLYHEVGTDKNTGYPYVFLKTGVPDSDASFIYYYATNEEARLKWYAIKYNMLSKKKSLDLKGLFSGVVPLKIDFPFTESRDMDVIALKDEPNKRIVVYKILDPKALIYKQDKIIVRRQSLKSGKIEDISMGVPQNVVYRTKTKDSDILTDESPSYRNHTKIITDEDEDNFFDIEIIKEIVNKNDGKAGKDGGKAEIISAAGIKDLSLSQLRDGKNSDVRPGEIKKAEGDYFTFDDFKELLEIFKKENLSKIKENSFVISDPVKFPIERKKKRYNKKESYDGKNLRDYIVVRFQYEVDEAFKNVLLIELSQKNLEYSDSGFSVFIFISDKYIDNNKEKFFLRKYAANINFERIENNFEIYGIIFLRKKHPDKKDKSKSFKAWCGDLERKLK